MPPPQLPTGARKKGRLVKLKLGSGPSSQGLHNKDSATAVEDFLRLNFALLDVKKFQRVNVEAARKILKKHDKRTALTASDDLRTFMAQQEAERRAMGINPVGLAKRSTFLSLHLVPTLALPLDRELWSRLLLILRSLRCCRLLPQVSCLNHYRTSCYRW